MTLFDPAVKEALRASPALTVTASGNAIPYPFPSPADWRDHWIYFLLVDRFNNPVSPPSPDTYPCFTYQGGNFAGIQQQLPYLKSLGVGAIWVSPVLINPQWFHDYWGGYGTLNFIQVEPRFCSDVERAKQDAAFADKEFRTLVDEAHALGIYVILDIVLNHAGHLFSYEGFGDTAPWSDTPYNIQWRDEEGVAQPEWTDISTIDNLPLLAGVWPEELQNNEFFRRKGATDNDGDFGGMKEFVTEYRLEGTNVFPVRNHLIRAYQYLIAKFDLDGYRIDTLMYIEPEFARIFGNSMREYALSIGKKNFFTFGEVWKDDDEAGIAEFIGRNTEKDHDIIGIDAAIDFPMRKRLVNVCKGFAAPEVLSTHFDERRQALKKIISSHGDAGLHYITFLDNHDLNERFHIEEFAGQTRVALTCLMTMQGIPCIYYGNEQGLEGKGSAREFVRQALWSLPGAFDQTHSLYSFINSLTILRNQQPALRYGRQYFRACSGDGINFGYSPYNGGILAFSRILNDKELLVIANNSTTEVSTVQVIVDSNLNPEGKLWTVLFPFNAILLPPATTSNGPYKVVTITVKPMEVFVLG